MPYMLVLQAVQQKVLLLGQAELLPDHISQGLYQLELLSFCSLALPPYAELIQLYQPVINFSTPNTAAQSIWQVLCQRCCPWSG